MMRGNEGWQKNEARSLFDFFEQPSKNRIE